MIDQLKSMAIFVSVVDEKSFRGAAKKLLVSPSVVSLHIKTLEEQLGAALLYRSTRNLSLTREGKRLYGIAKKMVATARDGLELFGQQAAEQLTDLRVAIPDTLVSNPVFSKITAYAKSNQGIRLILISSDIQQNLVREGHDVAVRMGKMTDSDMKIKRISEDDRIVIASPEYLSTKPKPNTPDELKDWEFISFSAVPDGIELSKDRPASELIWGKTVALADSVKAVCGLAVEGLGIATLPYHEVKPYLDDGRLEQVLPEWSDRNLGIYVVWPRNADLNIAIREFIKHMGA